MPETRHVAVLARAGGFTNPESAELLPDGETIVVANAAISVGVEAFRQGAGLVYRDGEAYISRLRFAPDGTLAVEVARLLTGMTGTLGTDVLTRPTGRYPAGTALTAAGGRPITADGATLVRDPARVRQQILAYDPVSGERYDPIPLWEGSVIGRRFNPLEQPNGLAVDPDGNVYVTDIPNSNPDDLLPAPVDAAVYRIPHHALDGVVDGDDAAAGEVTRVVMPGWVNGAAVSPVDGTCWVVSCSKHDPAGGGAYCLTEEDFRQGTLPEPRYRGLGGEAGGFLDGVGVTRRGSVVVSNPVTRDIHVFPHEGGHEVLRFEGFDTLGSPADVNVAYPTATSGEPVLLVPDVSARGGSHAVTILDLAAL